jgi:nucleotide-binding universal stress UspA family protein
MTAEVQLNPIGILLALVFLSAMGYLFRWMFRVPPPLPQAVAQVQRSVTAIHRILVPVDEAILSARAVELAARLGEAQKAELILAFVVEVPLTLALDTPLPEMEARGEGILKNASQIATQHGLPVERRMIHHRQAADGILQLARDENVDAIVLGVGLKRRTVPNEIGRTITDILRRAPCEVIIDRTPIPV